MKLLLTTIAAVLMVGCVALAPLVLSQEDRLRFAAIDGNIEAVKSRLAAGANASGPDKYGWTALHFAASGGRKEIVELLIANGADVNQMSDRGVTPLNGAIGRDYTEITELLRKHGAKTGEELKAEGK